MPRAAQFNLADSKDVDFCSRFAADAISTTLGVTLTVQPDGTLLNEKNNVRYCVVAGVEVDHRLRVVLDKSKSPFFRMSPPPQWMVMLDCGASKIHLVHVETLGNAVREAGQKPHAGLAVHSNVELLQLDVLIDWATHAKVVRKSFAAKMDGDKMWTAHGIARAVPEQFCHLHVHSMYSLLDGASTIEGIAEKAKLNGQPGIALTDHGFMFGTWKFYKACKEWGVKPMLGCEVYLVDDVKKRYQHEEKDRRFEYHTTIIAMNQEGWENLCELLSEACRDHFYYVPRIDHSMLFRRNAGLIVLSGCFKGPVAWHLQEFEQPTDGTKLPDWYKTDPNRSRRIMRKYREVFGDRYYIELQSIDFMRYMRAMPSIAQMARDEGIPAVVTNDCHYEVAEDAAFQAMMTRISNSKVDEIGGDLKRQGVYYIKSRTEIDPVGVLEPEMFDRTCEIMERCTLDFPKGFLFPKYPHEQDVDWTDFVASKKTVVLSTGTVEHHLPARNTDPKTSHEAAQDIQAEGAEGRAKAVAAVTAAPGSTAQELDRAYRNVDGKIRKRLQECAKEGTVHLGADRPCSTSGKMAQTWYPGPGPVGSVISNSAA